VEDEELNAIGKVNVQVQVAQKSCCVAVEAVHHEEIDAVKHE